MIKSQHCERGEGELVPGAAGTASVVVALVREAVVTAMGGTEAHLQASLEAEDATAVVATVSEGAVTEAAVQG